MKAQTLSICLPGKACDKDCPYCVSKMTWAPPEDEASWTRNLPKVVHFARMAQVTDVIITGKGEPSLHSRALWHAAEAFADWPIVVQTNGKSWAQDTHALEKFQKEDTPVFNVIAVSIDHPKQVTKYIPLWEMVRDNPPMTARITVMLTPEVCAIPFKNWTKLCVLHGIRGLSFREITAPNEGIVHTSKANEVFAWIDEVNKNPTVVYWKDKFHEAFGTSTCGAPVIRRLPYGALIKDFEGISVTKFDYCIQDSNGNDDIRSLVYNQDGHLYTTWSSPASLIF